MTDATLPASTTVPTAAPTAVPTADTPTLTAPAFAALGLSDVLAAAVAAGGYTDPSPIQREAIPPLLAGKDVIGMAATGTGKTAAFALPLVQRLAANPDRKRPAALVLVPTRELAIQVAKAISGYGKSLKIKVVPVYGGAGFSEQVRGLRQGVDVIVATPGRALDHLRRGTLDLSSISTVVLDEADEMLDMGFADDLDALLGATPKERQTVLFSATLPPRIAAIANKHQTNPVRVRITAPAAAAGTAPKVREVVFHVRAQDKPLALARVLDAEPDASAIVFCRTRADADGLAESLAGRGFRPDSIHGGLDQEQRDRVMGRFRSGAVRVLVATDVAARGLDIGHLSHVVNFNVPESSDTYTHRIGRVGRAGREGVAVTLADPRERGLLSQIERGTGRRLTMAVVPTKAEIRTKRLARTRDTLRERVAAGGLEEMTKLLEPLMADLPPAQVAAAAVALLLNATQPANDTEPDLPAAVKPTVQPPPAARTGHPPRRTASAGRRSW